MATKVYTFHIAYQGLEDRIWRKVEVSSKYRLDRLGYMVLATFDTLAYHLFEFYYNGICYSLPDEDTPFENQIDMAKFTLEKLNLKIGDQVQMDYDFSTTQTFIIELVAIREMGVGQGKRYPQLIDGAGRGIIDDMSAEDLEILIRQIDTIGRTKEEYYYNGLVVPWDYRLFHLEIAKDLLKGLAQSIESGYAPFWD